MPGTRLGRAGQLLQRPGDEAGDCDAAADDHQRQHPDQRHDRPDRAVGRLHHVGPREGRGDDADGGPADHQGHIGELVVAVADRLLAEDCLLGRVLAGLVLAQQPQVHRANPVEG